MVFDLDLFIFHDRQNSNHNNDDAKKNNTGPNRTESKTAVFGGLREQIPDRGSQWAAENISDPKRSNRVEAHSIGHGDQADQSRKDQNPQFKAQSELFRGEIAASCPERKSKKYGEPVVELAAPCHNGLHRERPFLPVPDDKNDQENGAKDRGAQIEAHVQLVREDIRYLRAHNTEEHDRQPINGGFISRETKLKKDGAEEDHQRHKARGVHSPAYANSQIIRGRLSDRCREKFDDPERDVRFGDFAKLRRAD